MNYKIFIILFVFKSYVCAHIQDKNHQVRIISTCTYFMMMKFDLFYYLKVFLNLQQALLNDGTLVDIIIDENKTDAGDVLEQTSLHKRDQRN